MLKMPKAYFPVHLVVNVVAIGGPLSLLAIGGLAISGFARGRSAGGGGTVPNGEKMASLAGKNGDFSGKIWKFSWKMDEIWDFSQHTMVIWHDVCQWKMGFDLWNKGFCHETWWSSQNLSRDGAQLGFKLMEFNHSSFGHFQGKLTTSQCHYVCWFPVLWWEDIGSVDNTSTHLLPSGKVT